MVFEDLLDAFEQRALLERAALANADLAKLAELLEPRREGDEAVADHLLEASHLQPLQVAAVVHEHGLQQPPHRPRGLVDAVPLDDLAAHVNAVGLKGAAHHLLDALLDRLLLLLRRCFQPLLHDLEQLLLEPPLGVPDDFRLPLHHALLLVRVGAPAGQKVFAVPVQGHHRRQRADPPQPRRPKQFVKESELVEARCRNGRIVLEAVALQDEGERRDGHLERLRDETLAEGIEADIAEAGDVLQPQRLLQPRRHDDLHLSERAPVAPPSDGVQQQQLLQLVQRAAPPNGHPPLGAEQGLHPLRQLEGAMLLEDLEGVASGILGLRILLLLRIRLVVRLFAGAARVALAALIDVEPEEREGKVEDPLVAVALVRLDSAGDALQDRVNLFLGAVREHELEGRREVGVEEDVRDERCHGARALAGAEDVLLLHVEAKLDGIVVRELGQLGRLLLLVGGGHDHPLLVAEDLVDELQLRGVGLDPVAQTVLDRPVDQRRLARPSRAANGYGLHRLRAGRRREVQPMLDLSQRVVDVEHGAAERAERRRVGVVSHELQVIRVVAHDLEQLLCHKRRHPPCIALALQRRRNGRVRRSAQLLGSRRAPRRLPLEPAHLLPHAAARVLAKDDPLLAVDRRLHQESGAVAERDAAAELAAGILLAAHHDLDIVVVRDVVLLVGRHRAGHRRHW
mmetsp:Transcript_14808/g.47608  ORF Transcript_14808/g.47608 Transcript_14808/m.47608 type:complete len:684 (+) Transcript_14808:1666-3717(+)